jgi:hypothetical protein
MVDVQEEVAKVQEDKEAEEEFFVVRNEEVPFVRHEVVGSTKTKCLLTPTT